MSLFAIVGAGQVAATAVESLRREGYSGRIVVVGDEAHLPYQRPPLSKKYLSGEMPFERLLIKPASFYEQARAELRLGVRVNSLDLNRRELALSDGNSLIYERLLLATGSVPRKLNFPGHELGGIHYLRTTADVDRIRAEVQDAPRRVVIVGAGYIGLEVAATCRQLGHSVEVLEMADRAMNRVVAPEVAAFFTEHHRRRGVQIHTGTFVSAFEPQAEIPGRVGGVLTIDGRRFPADLVIIGVGVVANSALAEAAGLAVENGIAVDEHCRTSDPHVWAAGDCTSHPSGRYQRRVRLESVDSAFEQARTAAANMAGRSASHNRVPWFWSDQYELKLMIIGLNIDYDRALLRGQMDSGTFSCCYLKGRELLAVDCVNNPKDFVAAKKLIADRAHVDATKLPDARIALKDAVVV
jgi:3-phenylpropionate/trans-cinnamate dioxygenase ferredoxin reductase subunit